MSVLATFLLGWLLLTATVTGAAWMFDAGARRGWWAS